MRGYRLNFESAERRGRLIVFCGGDGAGKSTQILRLKEKVSGLGKPVLLTKQPTSWYREDRFVQEFLANGGSAEKARTLALFSAADRYRHCVEVIWPALQAGTCVLCDRYVFSSLAYFGARGVPTEFVARINAGIPRPDISFFLEVPAGELRRRLKERDGILVRSEEVSEMFDDVLARFRNMQSYFTSIDANADPDRVEADIWSTLITRCKEFAT